jgi:2-polyprenyl-3-methyl-5-hydroxy-6-metoxy-1,4-benzoquinol methylase
VSQYHLDVVDPTARNTSHALELELVGTDRRVLDVGCATGYLGEALAAQGCTVTGVEYDPKAAAAAREHIEEVVEADLNVTELTDLFPGREFDAIVFGDVLEHLMDPDAVLRSAVRLLAVGGAVILGIPNVTHGSVRLALLQGRWDYRETGLLDRTHIRFFTRESVVQMVTDAGLHITDFLSTVVDPLSGEVEIDDKALPGTIVEWVRRQPDGLTYQFVLRAEVGRPDEGMPIPDLIPAVELPTADDEHSALAALEARDAAESPVRQVLVDELIDLRRELIDLRTELTDFRRRILTLRDHAIGAEAAIGTARAEVVAAKAEAQLLHERLHGALTDLAAVKGSRTWRTSQKLLSPVRVVRRVRHRR